MQTVDLIKHLYHQNAKVRYKTMLVIGMVEETTAVGAVYQRSREEPEVYIKKAIAWAIQRIDVAKGNGFSTIDAIFDYFHINREIESGVSPEEVEVMRKMQQQFDSQLRDMERKSNNQRGGLALGVALDGTLVGGIGVGASQASSVLNSASLSMGDGKWSDSSDLRIPPTNVK